MPDVLPCDPVRGGRVRTGHGNWDSRQSGCKGGRMRRETVGIGILQDDGDHARIGRIGESPPLGKHGPDKSITGAFQGLDDRVVRFVGLYDEKPLLSPSAGTATELLQKLVRPFIRPEILAGKQPVRVDDGYKGQSRRPIEASGNRDLSSSSTRWVPEPTGWSVPPQRAQCPVKGSE